MKNKKTAENTPRSAGKSSAANGRRNSGSERSGKGRKESFLVVGLGASAGGIQALQEFFANVPQKSGIAYVVILHLSPDHDSKLAKVLQNTTSMPVQQVTERVEVLPDNVYVVPPNKSLAMRDGTINIMPLSSVEERRAPVDIFFRTLAESHHEGAVAVILSGTGANGSMGLKRIKENGGAAFVQNPREAEFNEMPRNAIATELVDAILPVAEIPIRILAYKEKLGHVRIPVEDVKRSQEQQQALRDIFAQLRIRTGHDFSNYKRGTVLRRIERRISVRQMPDLLGYAAYLRENPEEPQLLLKDLLISVTNFFRDRKTWEYLETEVLPRLFAGKKQGASVRLWAVGCATGEEAYSLAMLVAERLHGLVDVPNVQIFATDIDEQAIAVAREGLYTTNDAADVSPERLRRHFTKEGDAYRVRRELREMILFAPHNVIKDPPFSHVDLITCRNVLIYLNTIAQERVMETFHFAINPGGYLFIGSSESIDGSADLYAPVNKEMHFYQSRPVTTRLYPIPEHIPVFRPEMIHPAVEKKEDHPKLARITYNELHQQLLEQYAPPSVVVNEDYEILHLSERAGRYLHVAGGEPSNNLLKLVREDLRLELRTALLQAVQKGTHVEVKELKTVVEGKAETINLLIRPVLRETDTARGFILVIFQPIEDETETETVYTSPDSVARQLEQEVLRLKTQLRASVEQAEVQTEELRASNEELQAMNEELRSSAEELETSKEELQSINEELTTVNQELKVKIEELSQSNNNFQNLINSTNIVTIFLDRGFRLNLFSPAAGAIFNLLPSDVGRPLTDITNRLVYDGLVSDAEKVLDDLQTIEREVQTQDGQIYMMRVLPYRTSEDLISGAVFTFIDITARMQAEEHYRSLFNSIEEGFCIIEVMFGRNDKAVDYRFVEVNPAFEGQTGLKNVIGKTAKQVMPKLKDHWFDIYGEVARTGEAARFESHTDTPEERWLEVYAYRYGNPKNNHVAMLCKDISQRKRRELNLGLLAEVDDQFTE